MKLLSGPDTTTLFYKLYKLREEGVYYAVAKRRMSIRKRRLKQSIVEQLNKKGFRVATYTGDVYSTFYVFTPIRVTHCKAIVNGESRLVDTLFDAVVLKKLFNYSVSVDPYEKDY